MFKILVNPSLPLSPSLSVSLSLSLSLFEKNIFLLSDQTNSFLRYAILLQNSPFLSLKTLKQIIRSNLWIENLRFF